ncbi:hypothetical protein BN7_1429 [Wickerhamomyces ciferrii]|uniref:Uncharacterized protein n=1 Tax=Wickerhamomyces ciferrii (strain ATCC 14091 / BCRC 22168 / CBS 111 / JCM 3599 / NBRC 0793 / NRRL Y-1031 F-60-10) TaxID=1206466 RepID=K0KAB5_WICCF|nr:uncharacterized protein BN7_1429 [Wickerhamomyces ciferrii]CCH41890.1 hypothetical protein BN7_1429 [Wickerhamomyces ciferrii]
MTRVFLIGPSTPLGSEVLHQLLTDPKYEDLTIETHHRQDSYCKNLTKLTNNRVECHKGTLADRFLTFKIFHNTDFVINCDPEETKFFGGEIMNYSKFQNVSNLTIINTSKSSVDPNTNGGKIQRSYTNLSALKNVQYSQNEPSPRSLQDVQDEELTKPDYEYKISRISHPKMKTLLVTQPSILGTTFRYHLTKQVTRESMDTKHFASINSHLQNTMNFTTQQPFEESQYYWSHVNMKLLASPYLILLDNLLKQNPNIETGKHGIYFNENGLNYWKEPYSDKLRRLTENGIEMTDLKINFAVPESDLEIFKPVTYGPEIEINQTYKRGWNNTFSDESLNTAEKDKIRDELDLCLDIM